MRKAAWIVAMVLTGITGCMGLLNGPRELGSATTPLQQSVSIGVTLYGVLGVLAAIGLWRRRPWSVTVATAWALVVCYVATVASFAFSDPGFEQQGTTAGVIGACVSTLLIGALVVWAARVSTSGRVPKETGSGHIPSP
jgi:hypothetical protein